MPFFGRVALSMLFSIKNCTCMQILVTSSKNADMLLIPPVRNWTIGIGGTNMGQNGQNDGPQDRIGVFWQDLGHFAWIWAIMLGFGPFCLDLGHIAWIWAIWQNLGQNRPQRRRSPEDGVGGTNGRTDERTDGQMDVRTDGWTDGRTDSPCVLQDFVPFGAAALLPLNLNP